MRLDKFLGDQNIGTRKQIKEYLKNGRCKVNGEVVTKGDVHINELTDEICFDGLLCVYEKYHYYLLNKPQGVVSATYDGKSKTVLDLLKGENVKGLSPCGRLDIDTEGLLLITDDGKLIHNLLSPKKHVDKTYEVHLKSDLLPGDTDKLSEGIDIGDTRDDGTADLTLPAAVEVLDKDSEGRRVVLLTIREGRFHQVKRMFEALGNEVMFLRRLSMGPLKLTEDLKPGDYRALTQQELNLLKKQEKNV